MKLFPKSFRKKEYAFINENILVLKIRDYEFIKNKLPLHSVEIQDPFAFISFTCPIKNFDANIFYSHYGKTITTEELVELNPCSLCENELYCVFYSGYKRFQPKDYNFLDFKKVLEKSNFIDSKVFKNYCEGYCDSESGDESLVGVPQNITELILLLIFLVPLCFLSAFIIVLAKVKIILRYISPKKFFSTFLKNSV